MSDTDNPYVSPQSEAVPVERIVSSGAHLTDTMLGFLKGASPWLRFIGVLGFIGSGFMALAGIIFIVLFPLLSDFLYSVPGFDEIGNIFGAFLGGIYGVYFLGAGVVSFFPALFSYNFGAKIREFFRSNSEKDLEQAFKNNKSLWKFNGILAIVGLAFVPLALIIGIIVAVVAAIA
jgi:hypothetical protein